METEIPQRFRSFLWLLYHGKIMTNKSRMRRGFTPNLCCHFCPDMEENLDRLFRKCPQVQPLWKEIAEKANERNFQQLPFREWLDWNLTMKNQEDEEWKTMFAICSRWIRNWRNEAVFNRKEERLERMILVIHGYNREVSTALSPTCIALGGRREETR